MLNKFCCVNLNIALNLRNKELGGQNGIQSQTNSLSQSLHKLNQLLVVGHSLVYHPLIRVDCGHCQVTICASANQQTTTFKEAIKKHRLLNLHNIAII